MLFYCNNRGEIMALVGGTYIPTTTKKTNSNVPSSWLTTTPASAKTKTSYGTLTGGTYTKPAVNTGDSGSSGSYTPAQTYTQQAYEPAGYEPAMSDYGYSVDINVPDFSWNPTVEMLKQFADMGGTRANTVIDPQVLAVLSALDRFKTEAQNQRSEINPRYTDMSLALANVIKNQVYQPGVDSLIRRGAADSGALQQLGNDAGRYEVEQRGAVERERNSILNALANQVMGKEQETSDAQTALEKLRGQYTDVYTGEEEQKAYEKDFTGKEATFNADLNVGQLKNAVAAAIANQQYQQAVLAAQERQSAFENSLSEKQFGLQQALQNYQMRPQGSSSPTTPQQMVTVNTPYGQIPMSVSQAIQAGYLSGKQTSSGGSLAEILGLK